MCIHQTLTWVGGTVREMQNISTGLERSLAESCSYRNDRLCPLTVDGRSQYVCARWINRLSQQAWRASSGLFLCLPWPTLELPSATSRRRICSWKWHFLKASKCSQNRIQVANVNVMCVILTAHTTQLPTTHPNWAQTTFSSSFVFLFFYFFFRRQPVLLIVTTGVAWTRCASCPTYKTQRW